MKIYTGVLILICAKLFTTEHASVLQQKIGLLAWTHGEKISEIHQVAYSLLT